MDSNLSMDFELAAHKIIANGSNIFAQLQKCNSLLTPVLKLGLEWNIINASSKMRSADGPKIKRAVLSQTNYLFSSGLIFTALTYSVQD